MCFYPSAEKAWSPGQPGGAPFDGDVVELDDTLCPAPGAPEGAIALARQTAETQPEYVLLDQYANEANPDSHYRTTGPEIWRQTEGHITHFNREIAN